MAESSRIEEKWVILDLSVIVNPGGGAVAVPLARGVAVGAGLISGYPP